MNRNNATKNAAKILSAVISLVLIVMAPSALAVTKANFDKVTATFQWENAATPVPNLNCDDCAQQIDIGFDFPFAGERFNKVWVSSNGVLSLLDPMTEYNNTNLPTSGKGTKTSALIMPYWDDLNPMAGGSVTYATLGSAPNRRLVVSWNKVPQNSCILGILPVCLPMGEYNFQAILYEGGEIKFQYGVGDNNGGDATIGIEVTNDDYIKHSYNRNIIHANEALLFSPQPYVQSVVQPCGSLNSLKVRYSYPMSASASEKQNYDFVSTSTQGLNVTSASLSPDGYTVTLGLNKSLQAGNTYKLQIKDALSRAGRAINPNPTTRPISGSSGLIGTYYSQYGIPRAYHTGPWVQRNDAQVDFAWNRAVPDILPRGDDFSIHWEGYLIPSRTGSHVFRTYSDDGIRLWVNGTKILDAWNDHSPRYHDSSAVSLNAGEAVPIVLEHYERGGQAYARLFWDEPDGTSGNYALIPPSALSPCLPLTGPDHIRIEHDGNGLTCQAERITLKACADAACGTEYAGDVTVNLMANNGGAWSANPVTFNGHTDVQLSKTTPGDTTLSIASVTPTPKNPATCLNTSTNAASCTVVVSACATSFTCLEKDTLKLPESDLSRGRLYTKLAGTSFDIDVAALQINGKQETNYVVSGGEPRTVTVQLVDSSGQILNPPGATLTFTDADHGRKTLSDLMVNIASPKVHCHVVDATAQGDSTDKFAIRPTGFSSVTTSKATADTTKGSSATATPVLKAGSDSFDLTATAIAGYNGKPVINAALDDNGKPLYVKAHTDDDATVLPTGNFDAANAASGVATGSHFLYPEVGYFRFKPNGIYDDQFTAIDQPGDCTADFSNTLNSEGKYGCKFGNTNKTDWFGRFVPDHFALTEHLIEEGCITGKFSYMDQPFTVQYTIQAQNASGGITKNYNGEFAKASVSVKAVNNENNGDKLSGRLVVEPVNWYQGVYYVNDTEAVFNRKSGTVDGPFGSDSDPLRILAIVSDNEVSQPDTKEIGKTAVRFGRLVLDSVYGSEFADLSMPVRAEYYDGTEWRINSDDYCTTVNASDLTEEDVDSSDTLRPEDVTPSGGGQLSAGHSSYTLSAPGAGHTGSLKFSLTAPSWLQFDWKNDGVFNENPSALATFGVYQGNPSIIYQREVWAQ